MYRVILIALAVLSLGGCASFSFDFFRPAPQTVTLQLESTPPGADATTSIGPGCKTPCTVTIPAGENFSVTFALNKFSPETVPVQIIKQPGEFAGPPIVIAEPNPVVVQLQLAKPPKRPAKRGPPRRPAQAAVGGGPAPAASPFPNPR